MLGSELQKNNFQVAYVKNLMLKNKDAVLVLKKSATI